MAKINSQGYIERTTGSPGRNTNSKSSTRVWFLPKYQGGSLVVEIKRVIIPKHLEGRKVRFRMEVIEEKIIAKPEHFPEGATVCYKIKCPVVGAYECPACKKNFCRHHLNGHLCREV